MKKYKVKSVLESLSVLIICMSSCNKIVQIDPPTTSITTAEVFSDSANASATILGMYSKMVNTGGAAFFFDGALTIYCGLSADELINFQDDPNLKQVYTNTLLSNNIYPEAFFFMPAYQTIYRANACIEGIDASSRLSASVKNQFKREAKFIRALSYFYLINLFGDIPYVTTSQWQQTSAAATTPKVQVYQNIIADLKDAQNLPNDYSISFGERTRVNQWAATALLAKVYLYTNDYAGALAASNSVISNTGLFSLNPDLNSVFLKDNPEAILQWNINGVYYPKNATAEGYTLIPSDPTSFAQYYLSPQLLSAFEQGDLRKTAWVDSTNYSGVVYYYPYKYKVGPPTAYVGDVTEYYMVLRLAEQYLIRAEAEANGAGDGIRAAIDDLNKIRSRAGLPVYAGATDKSSILTAIYHERQIELFAEWGSRWFDLKRTGQIDSIMSLVTPSKGGGSWNSYQQLYPIPLTELQFDPNLKQNTGY